MGHIKFQTILMKAIFGFSHHVVWTLRKKVCPASPVWLNLFIQIFSSCKSYFWVRIIEGKIYCDFNGRIFSFLNKLWQSLLLAFLISLIILSSIFKILELYACTIELEYQYDYTCGLILTHYKSVAYRGGGFGVFNPPPKFRRPSKIVPKSTQLWKLLKIAEFRTPKQQDVRKRGSKILKLPRFAIVLH